ncbi:MAG: hypothetical protein AAGB11_03565, partial [Pseudomonadota bacterium]
MSINRNYGSMTHTVGLIESDMVSAASEFHLWQNEVFRKSGTRISDIEVTNIPLESALNSLLPLTTPVRTRYIFLETNSSWTAFFDNGRMGTDASTTMAVLAGRLHCRGMRVTFTEQSKVREGNKTKILRYGACILEV